MQIVHKIIERHGTNDPRKIAKQAKVTVVFEDLGKEVWGYYSRLYRIPQIHINQRLNESDSRFALGHELGHHFQHQHVNTPFLKRNTFYSIDRIEKEAHRFSVHLIIGLNKPFPHETTEQFLFRCGVDKQFHEFY